MTIVPFQLLLYHINYIKKHITLLLGTLKLSLLFTCVKQQS